MCATLLRLAPVLNGLSDTEVNMSDAPSGNASARRALKTDADALSPWPNLLPLFGLAAFGRGEDFLLIRE